VKLQLLNPFPGDCTPMIGGVSVGVPSRIINSAPAHLTQKGHNTNVNANATDSNRSHLKSCLSG